jgi:hypothetical protein
MSFFDEEPDGDPHGECKAEIDRLRSDIECLAALLRQAMPRAELELCLNRQLSAFTLVELTRVD